MRKLTRDDGQAIVEYALVLGGISLGLAALFVVSGLEDVFTTLIDDIVAAFA